MQRSPLFVLFAVIAVLAVSYYAIEPWAVTFVDDGPYFSDEFTGSVDDLPVHSEVQLQRFGRLAYTIESRTLAEGSESVLVLRDPEGRVIWARLPVKPDDELGTIEVRRAYRTWYGGWRIAIKPANQESGNLYLTPLGGFRFLNHSW